MATNAVDRFVLTRKLNYPELVFKERTNKNDDHFCLDSQSRWRLQSHGECYLCQRHKYCVVFFDQGNSQNNLRGNMGYQRVVEPELLSYLKSTLIKSGLNRADSESDNGPIIFTTSHKKIELGNRMINSSLYALLSIHECLDMYEPPASA